MLLKILFYWYMNSCFSSRKIANKLKSDLWFMYLAWNNKPDFRTINNFRKKMRITRENQILLLHKIIKKIVINENKVDVYFKFSMSDNKKFRHKKISENKFSLTALSKMVAMVILPP